MDEIIRVKNSSYGKYEELLIRRDNLIKESFQLEMDYMREFGDEILKLFELKLTCIRKKKTITYCQAIANRGEAINQNELQDYLLKEMAAYQAQLNEMVDNNNAAKKSATISQIELMQIKKIHRRLAKVLHPDINPLTEKNEKLMDLWQRIMLAYSCNNLKDLQELELLVNAALDELGKDGVIEIDIPNIDEKISKVEEEIAQIINTDPYLYKFLLQDENAVEEKHKALNEEMKIYEDYEKQLDELLQGLIDSGVTFVWEMN